MNTYPVPFLIMLCLFGCKQNETSNVPKDQNHQIVIGNIDSLYSDILGETRKLWVHVPDDADGDRRYPVLYLLDGPAHFHSVTGIINQLSVANGNHFLPEMIVVAIPNTNRSRDLTPTEVTIDIWTGDSISIDSGGGGLFLEFIERELVPYINHTYPAAPYRTFVGHSFGGLSVINTLVTKPDLFDNYIAIDPSLWWDNGAFGNSADSLLSVNRFNKKGLFLGIANTMSKGLEINTVESDTTQNTFHIRSILQFVKSVEKIDNGLEFGWKYYENDDHGSVPLITEYDALRFLFAWFPFRGEQELYENTLTLDESIQLVHNHYENVSANLGYEVLPDEGLVNRLGYFYIDEKMLDKAAAFFDMNIQNFPNSGNVYDSRGDCYLAAGDSVKALEYFKKALQVEPNDYSQKKIDQLIEEGTSQP